MKQYYKYHWLRSALFNAALASMTGLCSPMAHAAFSFTGIAAGDATSDSVIVWTRAADDASPVTATVTLSIATDNAMTNIVASTGGTTAASNDYTLKFSTSGLQPSTVYFYQFVSGATTSNIGRFKTAPAAGAVVPVHFGFSGDVDGLMRPYALASTLPGQALDFYVNLGDTIYENASNVAGNAATPYLNSPSVTLSGSTASLNGVPAAGTTFATQAQLFADYSKKYREQFLPVNIGGQNCLKDFYAGQGNYTLLDNHELGNRQYINGGAPAGGSVGGAAGNDMPTGRGVDARANGTGNVGNINDANSSASDYMNRSAGFQTLQQVYLNYQPIAERGSINSPSDPRSHGTKQLYFAQSWGKNALFINVDDRSYRDIRIKTADGSADDTGSRADNPNRSYLGATQLAWLQQTLLAAQNAGTPWKFIAVSNPIDQIGPIGGALSGITAASMASYSGNAAYGPVAADGGKAWVGGYRAERNALLKFIAEHQITNVVFLSTDDHQNRINELLYSPSGRTGPGSPGFSQSDYKKVPYCFEIVCGPLGATGPDLFLNHDFAHIKGATDLIANAQAAAGVDTIGLQGYPGLHNVVREGDPNASTNPQPVDFYSPDTFNYNLLDVSADGKTLTVKSIGINSTAQNSASEYNAASNPAREIFSFQVDAADPLAGIDHIIVVYQENWSFDGLYGSFPGANGRANASAASLNQIDRLSGNLLANELGTNNYNNPSKTSPLQNTPPQPFNAAGAIDTAFPAGLNTLQPFNAASYIAPTATTGDIFHRYWQEQFQTYGVVQTAPGVDAEAGNNSGFMSWSDNPGMVMSYYDATNLPEGLLAQQYTMCDNFFHSAFGGSFLNHQFLIAAAPPVYTNMPTGNNGNIAYLDGNGVFVLNSSGASAGKIVRDGNITPVAGDQISVTLNGVPNTPVTLGAANAQVFAGNIGTTFDKHYAVNTIFSANLQSHGSSLSSLNLLPSQNNTNPAGPDYHINIGDLLDAASVSWKWYSGGWEQALQSSPNNPITQGAPAAPNLFQWHHQAFAFFEKSKPFDASKPDGRNPYAAAHLQDETVLYTDIASSTLPAVSFVKFLGPDNEHPGYASLQQGQQHVADLVAKVQANPALWAHTAIIVTYDEHGGRWDHVTPPQRDIWGPGVRVPTIVISPLAKQAYVDHTQYDTSSVLKTIEQRFRLPSLNATDAGVNSLAGIFTTTRVTRSGFTYDRRSGKMVQQITVTNNGATPLVGPIAVAFDNLSVTTSLTNASGTTANGAPLGSPYVTLSGADLAPGASVSAVLQFTRPATGGISYGARVITATVNP
ncbi:MAG: alkaline phosphatase family protein [Verrucomicrobiota bacterium]